MAKVAKVAWIAFIALLLASPARRAEARCDDPFADPDDVLDLHIRISRADWDAIRNQGQVGQGCAAQYPYFEVEFRCADEPWISIGARRKRGDQRGKDTNEKPPLKLDFNRVIAGQRWPTALGSRGFRRLSLNNGQEDNPGGVLSALLTEHLAWRLMAAEVPRASRVAYARLTIAFPDGESVYHGLYILIEDIDRTAIRTRFASDAGRLLKTTSGSCRDQVVFDDGEPNGASAAFEAWMALDPGDFAGEWLERTDAAIDLEELLRGEALRDVLANGADTVLGTNQSNFLSFDSLDPARARRHYLPWDLDDVFRPYPQDVAATTPIERNCSAVGDKTRCEPEIRQRYLEVACQLTNGTLHQDKLLSELAALDALVAPIAAEEVATVWGDSDPFDETVEGTYASELARMQSWIPERIASVRAQITAEGVSCQDGCADGESEDCLFADCPGQRRCEDERWTTCVVPEDAEIPSNGSDDDCDGRIDEGDSAEPSPDAGPPDAPPATGGGCGCQAQASSPLGAGSIAALFLVVIGLRRLSRPGRRD